MTKDPAPQGLVELTVCRCKKSSCRRRDCSCRNRDLICTEVCACLGNEDYENSTTSLHNSESGFLRFRQRGRYLRTFMTGLDIASTCTWNTRLFKWAGRIKCDRLEHEICGCWLKAEFTLGHTALITGPQLELILFVVTLWSLPVGKSSCFHMFVQTIS